jgi:nicotinate-nucleotide adenylyltransferase
MQRKEFAHGTLVFVPAAQNPLKANAPHASAEDRVQMIQLAVADALPDISCAICTIELTRPGPSYTVDTVAAFRSALPSQAELVLLLGGDSVRGIERWQRYEDLLRLLSAVWVALRENDDRENLLSLMKRLPAELACKIFSLENEPIALSSTDVRERARRGLPLGDILTPAVEQYIRSQRLYLVT